MVLNTQERMMCRKIQPTNQRTLILCTHLCVPSGSRAENEEKMFRAFYNATFVTPSNAIKNTIRKAKGVISVDVPSYGLNSTTTVHLGEWLWH